MNISSGVLSNLSIGAQNTTESIVITTANTALHTYPLKTYFLSSLYFPAPNCCATGIANPLHIPIQKPIIIKFIELVAPTPARADTPNVLPTIIVSTRL